MGLDQKKTNFAQKILKKSKMWFILIEHKMIWTVVKKNHFLTRKNSSNREDDF